MKFWIALLGFFVLPGIALSQGVRYDSNVFTSANNAPPGSQTTMYTVPFAVITVCSYPASGQPCTNTAAIYSNSALTVPIANSRITADVHGRFGFWASSGMYAYSVVVAGAFQGNYAITLGGTGGPSGFPIIIGATSIGSSSTTTAVTGLSVNGVTLDATGGATSFLNRTGAYSIPVGLITTLTTTGSSGPSSYSAGTLNIPQYSGGGTGYFLGTPTVTVSGTPASGQQLTATSTSTAGWANPALTGQTTNCLPKAANATSSSSSSSVCDDGTTVTITEQTQITDTTHPTILAMGPNGLSPAVITGFAGWGIGATLTTGGFYKMPDSPCSGPFNLSNASGIVTTTCGPTGENVVSFSATPTFSVAFQSNIITLTGNVTGFTLASGTAGQSMTLTFCQDATGSRTVAGIPANVRGMGTIGSTLSECSSQRFTYSGNQTAWIANGTISTNE